RHQPHFLPVTEDFCSRRKRPAGEYLQPQETAVDVPGTVTGHHDRLLTEKAPLRVTHRTSHESHFHHETILVDVLTEYRHSRFDSERFERLRTARSRTGRGEHSLHTLTNIRTTHDVEARHAE